MPYLRIHAPELSFEQKKIMAAELTDAILTILERPPEARDYATIQFIPYRLENMAVGGRLLSETEEPSYQLEFHSFPLTQQQKDVLVQRLMPLLLDLLHLPPSAQDRITLLFEAHTADNVVFGGRSSSVGSRTAS